MAFSSEQTKRIENAIKESLRKKFQNWTPESKHMPFHHRLLGKDRMALYSFIQSLNTTFGTSIYEPVAETLAGVRFSEAKRQYTVGETVYERAQDAIQEIMNALSTGGAKPEKTAEIERIRAVCREGERRSIKPTRADLRLVSRGGELYLFDLKTAKPNIGNFKEYKRTLLEWAAVALAQDPKAEVHTLIAIPYNPYHPKPYQRWTIAGMLDLPHELKVAEEFWDFLGGVGTYDALLDCFERVGIEMRVEIDEYFAKFGRGAV